jgi:hypothetical protein
MTISLSIFLVRNENGNGCASYLGENFIYLFICYGIAYIYGSGKAAST